MRLTGKPLLVLLGPTAVGKTAFALEIAQAIDGEVVGADSRQVYRYMDIGTAKPTSDERARVPHHLIDIVDPDENLSLAQYQKLAYTTIADIHARDRIPMLVGGTGQYITAVIEGWSIPEVPPNYALRTELETFAAEHGSLVLHARLQTLDPTAADKIEHQNVRRVIRALEVCIETGTPISELQRKQPPGYALMQFGLTLERERLYQRADMRVDQMVAAGFVDEVRHLLAIGYDRKLPSMSGLGYSQFAAHLLGGTPLDEAVTLTKLATHDFIRRQYTWFRKYNKGIVWHDAEAETPETIIEACRRWLS